jgi:hypothetical protein
MMSYDSPDKTNHPCLSTGRHMNLLPYSDWGVLQIETISIGCNHPSKYSYVNEYWSEEIIQSHSI